MCSEVRNSYRHKILDIRRKVKIRERSNRQYCRCNMNVEHEYMCKLM